MKKTKITIILMIFIVVLVLLSGCLNNYPIYQSHKSDDSEWYTVINDIEYVLWPDQNWFLLNDKDDTKVGYLDSKQISLYTVKDDPEHNFIKVYETGADVLHVPLVKKSLADEFTIKRIDAIEWTTWGIHTENLAELIGDNAVTNQICIDRFLEFFDDFSEEPLTGEWTSAGTIYCYNSDLPNAIYALKVQNSEGICRCSGYNSNSYVLIPMNELDDIFRDTLI